MPHLIYIKFRICTLFGILSMSLYIFQLEELCKYLDTVVSCLLYGKLFIVFIYTRCNLFNFAIIYAMTLWTLHTSINNCIIKLLMSGISKGKYNKNVNIEFKQKIGKLAKKIKIFESAQKAP